MKIIKSIEDFKEDGFYSDFFNCHEDIYIEDSKLKVHRYVDSYTITDITDALRIGKTCTSFSLRVNSREGCPIENYMRSFDMDLRALFDHLMSLPFEMSEWGSSDRQVVGDNIEVYRTDEKAVRFYSPFNHHVLKPMKKLPSKWNLRHFVQLVVNGQYEAARCNGRYSDDYAFDAQINYGIGEINAIAFMKRVIESPSGWHVYHDGTRLHVNCHSFDCNSLVPMLEKPAPKPEPEQAPARSAASSKSVRALAAMGISLN